VKEIAQDGLTNSAMTLKKLLFFLVALAAAMTVLFWRHGDGDDYVNFPPSASGPWVAFGDSLTEGAGASSGFDYPHLLSQRLGVPITNLGRSGETTADGLRRLEDLARLRPRVVLLCLGGNDSLNGHSSQQAFANLGAIIDRLHREGSFVVLIGVHSASLRDKNETRFAELAREKRVFYIPDILRGVLFKPVYMSDAIHPNEEGYKRIADRLAKSLRPLLSRLNAASTVKT